MRTDDDPISDEDATSTSSRTEGVFGADPEQSDAALEPYSEVLSGVMDEHDSDSTGELELPGMNDDPKPRPAKSDPGFDGWLDDDQVAGSADDPYSTFADDQDDAAAEIADWVAFTSGGDDESADTGQTDVVVDVTDDSIAAASVVTGDATPAPDESTSGDGDTADADEEPHEDTIELFLDGSEKEPLDDEAASTPRATDDPDVESGKQPDAGSDSSAKPDQGTDDEQNDGSSEKSAVATAASRATDSDGDALTPPAPAPTSETDEGDHPVDPDELLVLPVVTAVAASAPAVSKATGDGATFTKDDDRDDVDDDDTGEVPIVGGASADSTDQSNGEGSVYDFDDFADDRYLQKATREHHDLAAAVDQADSEDTQQVAVSAAIPGLESGVVGFDEVVAAGEGEAGVPAAPRQSSDLLLRVGTGIALVAAFLLSLLWRPAITVLALAAFVVAAGEFYSALMHRRYKPMSIFGFVGIIAAGLGAVVWGVVAIPIAFGLLATVILLYGAVSHRRMGAVNGFALTVLVAGWIGGFGAFAFPIIAAEDFQVLVLTVVAIVALVDIAAYFVGSSIGRRHFAPTISPKKTVEGLVGGTLMAFLAGAAASFFVEAIDLPTGLVLGAVVAVVAPLGDLAVSVVKRSLDIKDMGSILPGHGGLLDRIDAIIAVVPAAWAVFVWTGLL
ncbi:MAG: phosphatidate cytidylyltransferase [Acidimicrobiia bacterium]